MDAQPSVTELVQGFNFLDLPIGVYVVMPDGQLIACNRRVREMFHLPLDAPLHANVASFYAHPPQREQLLAQVRQADERGTQPSKDIILLRINGAEIFVEDYCKPLRDPATNQVVGYIGCLVDVTTEEQAAQRAEEAQRKIEVLTADIGKVWHASTSTFVMARQTLDGVIAAMAPNPFGDRADTTPEEIDDVLVKQAARLASVIERFLQTTDAAQRLKALPEARWQLFENSVGLLREIRERVPIAELRLPTCRKTAYETNRLCRDARAHHLPRELTRDVQHAASELERLAVLFDAITTQMAIVQMELPFATLREYITAEVRTQEPRERLAVKSLIEEAIKRLGDFARSCNVEIHWRDRDAHAEVEGNRRDLVRVLANLLHNAIKYTWRRERTRASWVEIHTTLDPQNVCIQFENWGVPIAREEIDERLVFQLGYRGKWSTDRGRLGTGIGLTDAAHVARDHGGAIRVESKPAAPAAHPQDEAQYYQQPFITRVTFCLPVRGQL